MAGLIEVLNMYCQKSYFSPQFPCTNVNFVHGFHAQMLILCTDFMHKIRKYDYVSTLPRNSCTIPSTPPNPAQFHIKFQPNKGVYIL